MFLQGGAGQKETHHNFFVDQKQLPRPACRFLLSLSDCQELLAHPVKPLYLGAVPMALATIVNGLPLFLLPRWGSRVTSAAVALWGVDAALAGACSLLLPLHLFIRHQHRQGAGRVGAGSRLPAVAIPAKGLGSIQQGLLWQTNCRFWHIFHGCDTAMPPS